MGPEELRPAFYALRPGGWRDYVTVLHAPYTLWNLAYVAVGAALAPEFRTGRMLWTMAAFALALGVAAHALDELNGRPLRTGIGDGVLVALALASLAGACAIGVWAAFAWDEPGLLAFVAAGAAVVPAYNLEWLGGAVHNTWGLALSWAAFPVLTAYFAQAGTLRAEAVLAAGFAAALIVVQRTLSTPVRHARRVLGTTEGVEPMERSLRILPWAIVLLAGALVVARLT
ncbi:MAG TPA: hypothetical protein VFB42_13590 [Gaiellaceae bacterium]|nr:hypothetical protein [Gaiellaceae bacterium]